MAPLKRKLARATTEEAQPRKSAKVQTKATSKSTKNAQTTKKVVVKQLVEETVNDAEELETAIQMQYASESSDSDAASDVGEGDSGAEDLFKAMADEIILTPGVQRRLDAAKVAEKSGERKRSNATVFLASMPHDLTVPMLYRYFSQFGRVTRAFIPDTKRGGKTSYAYISFANEEVAKVVVDTMNNYMLDGKLLHCSLVSKARLPTIISKFFKKKPEKEESTPAIDSNPRKFRGIFTSTDAAKEFITNKQKWDKTSKEKLQALGVDYDFPQLELVTKQ
ncbi:nucleolar protein [Dispira simplex]|nr:nucleolar protein [Dispira simplex]